MKKFLSSATKTLYILAAIHVVISLFMAIAERNINYLNVFTLVNLHLILPQIGEGVVMVIASFLTVALLTLGIYIVNKKR